MNKILIAGSAGFIGNNLASFLLENDKNLVYGIDNFTSGDMGVMYNLLRNSRFSMIEADLEDEIEQNCDQVYFLAGCGDYSKYFENNYLYINKQLKLLDNILNYSKLTGSRLICVQDFIKNSQVNPDFELYNNYLTLCENLILNYAKNNELDAKVVRISPLYGVNIKKTYNDFVIQTIIKAFNNEKIELEFDEVVYFTYIKDAVVGLDLIMNSFIDKDLIDLSVSNQFLKSDIAKLIIEFTKSKSNLVIKNNQILRPNYTPDFSLLNNELNFRCSTQILDGISRTVSYVKLMYFS